MSLSYNLQLYNWKYTSRIIRLSNRLTLSISNSSLAGYHSFFISHIILSNPWMFVWCLESCSTGEKLSSLTFTFRQASHLPLYLIFSWSWMIIYIIHNTSVFCTHAISRRLRFHLLFLRVIPSWRRVIVGFFFEISLGNSNLLRLRVL